MPRTESSSIPVINVSGYSLLFVTNMVTTDSISVGVSPECWNTIKQNNRLNCFSYFTQERTSESIRRVLPDEFQTASTVANSCAKSGGVVSFTLYHTSDKKCSLGSAKPSTTKSRRMRLRKRVKMTSAQNSSVAESPTADRCDNCAQCIRRDFLGIWIPTAQSPLSPASASGRCFQTLLTFESRT